MRKLMWFSIGFAISCVVAIYLLSGNVALWLGAIIVPAVVLLLIKHKNVKIAGVILLGCAVGFLWNWGYDRLYLQPAKAYDGQLIMTHIQATDYNCATEYGGMVDGKITLGDKVYKVRLYMDDNLTISPGDEIYGVYELGLTTPSGKEESDYYQGKGIFLIATTDGDLYIEKADKVPAKYFPVLLRSKITERLHAVFADDVVGFARALLLGDSSLLTYEQDTAFKTSGIRHIIAVSGLHVSILFSLVYKIAFKRRLSTALLGIPVLILFAAVAGFTPSINRACIMQILMMLALLFDKDYDQPTALAFSVLVMLAVNPMTVTSVSFQLSVCCVMGILMFSGRVSTYILNRLGRPKGKTLRARLARWTSSGIGVTLSAMVFTTPLLAWYFGSVSLVGVFANLLTLWAVSIVFYGIMAACVLGWIWLPLGKIVAWVISWFIRYILLASRLLAKIPLSAVYTDSIYIVLWIVVCYLLFAAFLLSKKKRPLVLLAMMAGCLCLSLIASYVEPRLDDYRVTVYDVEEGQAILLQAKGEYYLIDCGGSSTDEAVDTVAQSLLSQGITRLDGIVVTHYDVDHAGGVPGLLSRVDADVIYLPDIPDDGNIKSVLADRYESKVQWINDKIYVVNGQNKLTLIPALPDSSVENECSLCVLFQAENCDILITGDRGVTGEKALLKAFDLPQLELLVAGHHGSAESTNFELLHKTRPKAVVISTGSRYNGPSEELLDRLRMFGCLVWRTDQQGTIIFRG